MTVGLTVTHRRYVTYADAHYGGNLVNGAYVLDLFGDVCGTTRGCHWERHEMSADGATKMSVLGTG